MEININIDNEGITLLYDTLSLNVDNLGDVSFVLGDIISQRVTSVVLTLSNITLTWQKFYLNSLFNLVTLYITGGTLLNSNDLPDVIELSLISVELTSIPIEFFKRNNLKYLTLSNNRIDQLIVPYYNEDIELLDISYNSISSIDDIRNLPELKHLNISHNRIYSLWQSFNKIEYLEASHNIIDTLDELRDNELLKELDIAHNLLESLDGISALHGLEELIANNNIIDMDDVSGLINMHKLTSVGLSGNRIIDIGRRIYIRGELYLDLGHNYLSYDGLFEPEEYDDPDPYFSEVIMASSFLRDTAADLEIILIHNQFDEFPDYLILDRNLNTRLVIDATPQIIEDVQSVIMEVWQNDQIIVPTMIDNGLLYVNY